MINERMQELINTVSKGNKRAFANLVGVTPTVLENIVGTRQGKPGYDLLEKIAFSIENINLDWLLTGRGSMFLHDNQLPSEPQNTQVPNDQSQIVKIFMDKINEKDTKIDQLHIELRSMGEELASIKVKLQNGQSPPLIKSSRECDKDLYDAGNACLETTSQKPSSLTKKTSSVTVR